MTTNRYEVEPKQKPQYLLSCIGVLFSSVELLLHSVEENLLLLNCVIHELRAIMFQFSIMNVYVALCAHAAIFHTVVLE